MSLVADLLFHSYGFIERRPKEGKKDNTGTGRSFNFKCINDVLSFNNPGLNKCLSIIYLPELEIRDT